MKINNPNDDAEIYDILLGDVFENTPSEINGEFQVDGVSDVYINEVTSQHIKGTLTIDATDISTEIDVSIKGEYEIKVDNNNILEITYSNLSFDDVELL